MAAQQIPVPSAEGADARLLEIGLGCDMHHGVNGPQHTGGEELSPV